MSTTPASRPTLLVGLTGGLASGKSTVARLMAERGCTVTDADRLVADLYRPGEAGAEAVRELFGEEMLDARGAVDKEALGRRVFEDKEARQKLERAIHPLVGAAFAQLVARSEGIVVFEATLLAETGGWRAYEVVITVEADESTRLERAVGRGMERADAEARLAAQATQDERTAVADIVIENDGSLEQLERRVDEVVEELEARLDAKG